MSGRKEQRIEIILVAGLGTSHNCRKDAKVAKKFGKKLEMLQINRKVIQE